ncbi:hypothetical protein NGI46_26105 [Peribacillus butanolivorans]|uniref:MFS transporter n=1 Tax=Peribacillus butanolivorans TaxID=421767 RepID=UPI00207D284F|nr:MFS transporter [Peribacillus butanolivorans]MCO0600795.1 hypothetical protein [Peribacillus butanolivorans]
MQKRKSVKGIVKNKPLLSILAASLIFMMCTMLIGAINVYLFKDYFSNASALSLIGFVQTAAVFVAMPIANHALLNLVKKKRRQ